MGVGLVEKEATPPELDPNRDSIITDILPSSTEYDPTVFSSVETLGHITVKQCLPHCALFNVPLSDSAISELEIGESIQVADTRNE